MSPELLLLLLQLLALGPAARFRWEESAGEVVQAIREQRLETLSSPALRGWIRKEEGGVRSSITLTGSIKIGGSSLRLSVRSDRVGSGDRPTFSPAASLTAGGWRMSAGPLKGGLGSGLLLRGERWMSTGAAPGSAWRGIPTGLRAGPVTDSGTAPAAYVLGKRGGRGVTLALISDPDRSRGEHLAAGYRVSECTGILFVGSGESGGVEVMTGMRRGGILWRLGVAGWGSSEAGPGHVIEAALSGRGDGTGWEARIWAWSGSRPLLAPPVEGATSSRRVGLRLAAALRPPGPLKVDASMEVAGPEPSRPRPGWWREQLEIMWGGYAGPGGRLRLRRTVDMEEQAWTGRVSEERLLMQVRVWSGSRESIRVRGELRLDGVDNGGTSRGVWVELDYHQRAWNAFVRGTYSLPEGGIPLYWFEPGPVQVWRVRREGKRGARIIAGLRTIPQGLYLHVVLGEDVQPGFLIGWRSTR